MIYRELLFLTPKGECDFSFPCSSFHVHAIEPWPLFLVDRKDAGRVSCQTIPKARLDLGLLDYAIRLDSPLDSAYISSPRPKIRRTDKFSAAREERAIAVDD